MSERSVQADVVKKANLRYKASKLRGTAGTSVQGPKTYKDFYIVFRAVSGERKELEIYSNERRFADAGPPKLIVDLKEVAGVHVINGKRNEFYVEKLDGGMGLFETKSPDESMDWVSCLNAVLFAKGPNGEGILQYDVDLQETEHLSFRGPAILELRDGELIVCRRDSRSEIVKWRLSHIRSFKAKKRLLTIYSGSRSSTGVGEFLFKSDRSVEITHAIETVVGAMAKDKKSTRAPKASHSHIPSSNGNITARNWSSSVVESIPDFQPPAVYEELPESDIRGEVPGYGKLNFRQGAGGSGSPPHLASPEHEAAFRRGVRHTSPTPRPIQPPSRAAVTVPTRRGGGRRDYEDLDLDEDEEEVPRRPENYSRLDREKSPLRSHGPPLPSRPHVPPPAPKPNEQSMDVPDGLYAAVNKPRRPPASTVHGTRPHPPPPMAAKPSLSGSNPDLAGIGHKEYGKLDRRLLPPSQQQPQEEYNTLDHVTTKINGLGSPPEGDQEYGKLDRTGRSAVGIPHSITPAHIADQYGKLELNQAAPSVPPFAHYEMMDDVVPKSSLSAPSSSSSATSVPSHIHEEYGKLQHNSTSASSALSARGVPPHTQEEYGRLDRTATKSSVPSTPEDEYGHLETRPRTSSFNPYGTLNAEEVERAKGIGKGGGDNNDSRPAPPPGYENATLREPSLAYRMSVTGSQLTSKPQAPPRGASPSLQKKSHGYVNVDETGKVQKPIPPARPQIDASQPARTKANNSSSSHDPSLKSHDPNLKSHGMNGTAYSVRRKPVSVSSDYEDTEKLDFGPPKPNIAFSSQTPASSSVTPPPPPAPRRGVSNRNAAIGSNASVDHVHAGPTAVRPSIAPKPSKLKANKLTS